MKIGGSLFSYGARGHQSRRGANFSAFVVHFAVYCAKLVLPIPPCFGAKVHSVGLYQRARYGGSNSPFYVARA